jgi:centrosomal protein CEP290
MEESLEKMKTYFGAVSTTPTTHPKHQNETDSISMVKRLAVVEMKELNERQRADYAQRMYDEQRSLLRQVENRNLEIENNFAQLTKSYLTLQKTEQKLREELSNSVSKAINDVNKNRINELEKNEISLKLEVTRLKELTEITLYQSESLDFIQKLSRKELDCFNSIDISTDDVGKLHRTVIMLQISEATAIRKLQNATDNVKKLETQLLRSEQKLDKEEENTFYLRKEYTSKISYLRSIVQDLKHKFSGSIPLKQQEKFAKSKQDLIQSKKDLMEKIRKIDQEKNELEDKIAEYEVRMQNSEILKNIFSENTSKTTEKLVEWYKRIENLKTANLKLERSNKRHKEEVSLLCSTFFRMVSFAS